MQLCQRCIDAIKSRGEIVYVGPKFRDYEPEDEDNIRCEWCDEPNTLFDCILP